MLFGYQCEKCNKRFDVSLPIGKAPRTTPCPHCGGQGRRVYEGVSISVKVDGHFARSSTVGEEMLKKNRQAAERQKGRKAPVRLTGYDFGGGKVVEA